MADLHSTGLAHQTIGISPPPASRTSWLECGSGGGKGTRAELSQNTSGPLAFPRGERPAPPCRFLAIPQARTNKIAAPYPGPAATGLPWRAALGASPVSQRYRGELAWRSALLVR